MTIIEANLYNSITRYAKEEQNEESHS
jgi:hypothetical protein